MTCTCLSTSCEIVARHCRDCGRVTDHHVAEGAIQPVIYSECLECGHLTEAALMTPEQVLAEAQRGF